jgi:hypothetical protein
VRVAGDGGASKARERRLGEIPAEALAERPWKGKAHGSNRRSAC